MELFSNMFENFMGKGMKNYLDLTLIETYKVLVSDTDPWPKTFQPKKKIKLIDQMIDFFTEREEYERCAKLVKVKEQIIQDVEDNK